MLGFVVESERVVVDTIVDILFVVLVGTLQLSLWQHVKLSPSTDCSIHVSKQVYMSKSNSSKLLVPIHD